MPDQAESTSLTSVVVALRTELRRHGVARMLESIRMVGSCWLRPHFEEAVALAASLGAAVLIVAMGELSDSDVALLAGAAQGVKIVTLVEDADLTRLGPMARHSSGLLSISDLDTRTLENTLVRTVNGEFPMPQGLAVKLLSMSQQPQPVAVERPRMTAREQQAVTLLVEGLTNKQIARRLGISVHGAKRLVANVLAKLDCPNRTLAVAKVFREGLYEHYLTSPSAPGSRRAPVDTRGLAG
jgi:DNA-binding NarL/FixJ family response regulator